MFPLLIMCLMLYTKEQIILIMLKKIKLWPEKAGLSLEIGRMKISFHHLPAHTAECVSEYIYFCLKQKDTYKQKAKETKENRKTKETKKENETVNVVAVNNICRKCNVIQRYRLTIFSVYF